MITKHNLSDIVISLLEGKVTSQRIPSPRQIWLVGDMAMHQVMYADMLSNRVVDGRFYSKPKILAVSFDAVRNKKYTNLINAPILFYGSALILISPVQNESLQFIYKPPLSDWTYDILDGGKLIGQASFELENKKVLYTNIPIEYTNVLVKAVTSISEMDEDEIIPIPEHLENSMLDIVLQKFGIQQQATNVKNIYVQSKADT